MSATEHRGTRWEQCALRSSSRKNNGMAVVRELNVHKSHIAIVKTIQHSLFAQLTTTISATGRHTYSLMTTAQFERQVRTAGRSSSLGITVNDNIPTNIYKGVPE